MTPTKINFHVTFPIKNNVLGNIPQDLIKIWVRSYHLNKNSCDDFCEAPGN